MSRAALVLAPGEQQRVLPLVTPTSDLLGLRVDAEYLGHIHDSYFAFWPQRWFKYGPSDERWKLALTQRVDEAISEWANDGVPGLFREAGEQAAKAHFSAKLAPAYERVQLRPGDEPDDVPDGDLPALAAWALREAMRVRTLELRTCPTCRVPWLTAAGQANPYCLRPAPGHHTTCRELDAKARSTKLHADWQREYKRVYARKLRDTLSDEEWAAWRDENSRDAWTPFEDWQRHRSGAPSPDPKKVAALSMRAFATNDPANGAREADTSGRPDTGE